MWNNNYQYDLINRGLNTELLNHDGVIIDPFAEQLQGINLYSGELEWTYEYDEFDGIKYINQHCLHGNNLYFLTIDDEFITFDLTNKEILFYSDEMYFDYKLNVAFLNRNNMLTTTYDGKVILFENNGSEMVQRWIEDFGQSIKILDVKDNKAYVYSIDDKTVTIISFEDPKRKSTSNLIWGQDDDMEKIFIDVRGFVIHNQKSLYFINIKNRS